MKRFLAFMMGILFGIVFLFGAVGIATYTSITVVHPNEIYSDVEKYLGDLGDVSLLQAYYNILDLYEKQTGNLTNEKLYSVGDFLEDNNISTTDESGKTMAFGIIMPNELLDAPLFEYFNTNVDENGHTGVQRALKQIKLSSVPSIVNTFTTPGEDGQPVVSEKVIAELDNHSVFDLVFGDAQTDGETPQIVANLSVIFENITLADFVPAFRAEDKTENIMKNLLFAVGQAPIGKLIADLTGNGNILGSLNDDGSLSAVGKLTVADILGDSDPLISSLVGGIAISDLVNEQGEFAIVDALDRICIAGLVGLTKRSAQVEIAKSDIVPYYETKEDGSNGALIWSVGTSNGKYYISLNAQNDSVQTTWWEGQLVCQDTTHVHQAICFDYLWYAPCKTEHEHTGEYTVTTGESVIAFIPVETTSVQYTLAGIKLSCLFDETGAINFDNLIAQFDKHSVDAIINELLAQNEILDQVSALLQLDGMSLSDLLAEGGIDTLLSKVTEAPISHILQVFGVEGMDFIADIVGDMSINELIEGGYENISIGGLLGLVKREMDIADENGNLPNTVTVTQFTKATEEGTAVELSVAKDGEQYYLSTNYDKDADKLAQDYVAPTWYEGQLKCADESHTTFDTHEKACFTYVLYQACTKEDADHDHATEDAFSIVTTKEATEVTVYYVVANSLFATLGNMTIGGIVEGGLNTLFEELTNIKLSELFEMLGLDQMEGALDALSQLTIKQLMEGGYNTLTLGSLLGYKRYPFQGTVESSAIVTHKDDQGNIVGYVATIDEQIVLSTDGETWYNAKLGCDQDHTHSFDCYESLWYTACTDGCSEAHEHVTIDQKTHTLATGIFTLLVDLTIGDITTDPNSLMDKVFEVKLGDLLGGNLEGMMATLAEFSIKDLMNPDTLNGIGLGDILTYVRNDITNQVSIANGWDVDVVVDVEKVVVKQNSTTLEYAYFEQTSSKWYMGQMHCKDETHLHTTNCFGYIWYEKCANASCTNHQYHFAHDETNYGSIAGLYGVLADLTIGDLVGGTNIMDTLTNRLTLGDIFGNNIPGMLASLKDTPIAELSGAIETTKVGNLLGYYYDESGSEPCWRKAEGGPLLEGIEKVLADKTISDLKDFNSILNEVTLGDVLDPIPDMLKALADVKIPDLASKIDTLYVGDLLGYQYNPSTSLWEKEVGGAMQPLTGMEKIIAGKTVNDLKDFGSILGEVTLGDVLDPVPAMLEKLKDKPITSLGSEIDKLVVGDFLGYSHLQVDVESTNWRAVSGIDDLFKHTDGTFAKADTNGTWFVSELTCDSENVHTIDCYSYKWYRKCENGCTGATHAGETHIEDIEGNYFVAVMGITSKLAGKTINELSNLSDLMNDLTLNDVFGEGKVPGMLQSIADEKIAKLENALNKISVGEFLGYQRGERIITCGVTDPTHTHNEDLGDNNCCYQKKLSCKDTSHIHSAGCYIYCYEWWTLACSDNSHNHDIATTPGCYQKVSGITGKIANERLDTLSDLGNTIKTFTLSDVMGDDIPGMLKGIANTPIGELDTALDSLYLGEILEYTKRPANDEAVANCTTAVVTLGDEVVVKTNIQNTQYIMFVDGVWYDAVVSCANTSCNHNTTDCYGYLWYNGIAPATGITAKLANERVSELSSLGVTIQSYSLYDVLGDSVPAMLDSIKYQPINNLNNSINNIYVGEFLGYTKGSANGKQTLDCQNNAHTLESDHTAECYYDNYNWTNGAAPVDGMMAKIANKKVGNLGNLGDDISSFTFAEIMGKNDGDNAIIKELYDTPVGEIGSKMDTMMLGTAMGYYRKATCGQTHSHVDACYETDEQGKHVWYTESTCTNKVTAPQSAFVNSTLQGIGGDVSNIKLGELVAIDENSSGMLQALKDTPINGIGSAINSVALGTSMGFVRREMDDTSYTTNIIVEGSNIVVKSNGVEFVKLLDGTWYQAEFACKQAHTHNADCYGYVWYQACKADCGHESQEHIVINQANHTRVDGLNAKMSNLTVGNMDGQSVINIVTALSMKDMMDSGILNFDEDQKFKLAILFGCDDTEHKVTFFGTEFDCTLAGYFSYNATMTAASRPTLTIDQFYKRAHGITDDATLTDEQLAHRDVWQECTLTEFIDALLAGI